MSIPKVIHYCWFGHNPKPKLALKCIKSWRKHCPEYTIIEWNEDNFDITLCPQYVQEAYAERKWAFVTDYVRLKVIYENGGIYFDTDVKLLKSMDELLQHEAFFGFEEGIYISTGLGFGAVAGTTILKELMEDYQEISFIQSDGSYDLTTCPHRNLKVFLKHGLKQNNSKQLLDGGILILPTEYLCPISCFTGRKKVTKQTISVHCFASSWVMQKEQKIYLVCKRVLSILLGEKRYTYLKEIKKRYL